MYRPTAEALAVAKFNSRRNELTFGLREANGSPRCEITY